MKELKNGPSVVTNRQQEIVLKITLIEHMQEIRFKVIIVRKLLQRRVIQLISSATNAHSSEKLNEIKTIILSGYLNARGPSVSCVITCLFRKHP